MKHLLRVLFILALFCGIAPHARANGVDFHVQVLDPDCVTSPDAACTIHAPDLGVPFGINLTASTCSDQGITGLPTSSPFGCFVGTNNTGSALSSIMLEFSNAGLAGDSCDTDVFGTEPPAAFGTSSCSNPGGSEFDLTFTDGSILNTRQFVIVEVGEDPSLFDGFATVVATPEPDSFLLFATGAMMMTIGLFVNNRRRLAVGKIND
jgi:hypothetical protein